MQAELIEQLLNYGLAQAKQQNVEEVLFSASLSNKRGLSWFQGKLESVEIADELLIGVWLRYQGRWGVSSLETASEAALTEALRQACEAAGFSDPDPDYQLAYPQTVDVGSQEHTHIAKYAMSDFEAVARAMEVQAYAASALIKNIPRLSVGTWGHTRLLANSQGVQVREHNALLKAGLSVMASGADERTVNASEIRYFPAKYEPERLVQEVTEEACRRVEPRKAPAGTWPVLFDEKIGAELLATITPVFSGEALYRRLSRWEHKLNQHVASPLVGIRQDPRQGLMQHAYDAEGTPCQVLNIIHEGSFENYLHNLYTAKKARTNTTGNAAGGLGSAPGVAPHNIYWTGPGSSEDELLHTLGTGLLIKELHGASASAISGDFSYGGLGYWVENGRIQYPVADFTLAGNFFDMLLNIIGVGSKLEFRSPHSLGSYGGRALLVKALTIAS